MVNLVKSFLVETILDNKAHHTILERLSRVVLIRVKWRGHYDGFCFFNYCIDLFLENGKELLTLLLLRKPFSIETI